MAAIEENLRKIPPQNLEAEESVLGGMLLDNHACNLVLPILKADHFYREAHRKVFHSMVELNEHGTPVDIVTLTEALRQRGHLQEVGGATFIAELANRVPTAANAEYYARIVREKAILRGLISTATEIATEAYGNQPDVERRLLRVIAVRQPTRLNLNIRSTTLRMSPDGLARAHEAMADVGGVLLLTSDVDPPETRLT